MSIPLSDNLVINAPKPQDAKFGPWASVAAVLAGIPGVYRYLGLTVGVVQADNTIREYWYQAGVADADLTRKFTSADLAGARTVTLGGTQYALDPASGNVNLNDKFFDPLDVPWAVRLAVDQGTYLYGELQGATPDGSRVLMSFVTKYFRYVYERGYQGPLVWCRYAKF